jgi:hypothetical protein
MHEEEAPTGYVCARLFTSDLSRDRGGNGNVHVSWRRYVMGIAGGMSWHSSCPVTTFGMSGFEFLVVFLDSRFVTQ